jgi:hypothetical protein
MPYLRRYFIILYLAMFVTLPERNFSLEAKGMGGAVAWPSSTFSMFAGF